MATTTSPSSAPSPDNVSLKLMADTFGFKLVPKDYNCEKCVVLETEKRDLGNQVETLQNQNKNIIRQIVEALNPQQTQNQDDVNDDLLSSVVFQQRVVAQVEQSMTELRCLKELFKTKWSFEDILNGKVPQLPMMTRDPSSTGTASLPPPPAEIPVSSTSTFTAGTDPGPNANALGTMNDVIAISTATAASPSTSSSSSGSILMEAPTPYNSGTLRQRLRQRGMESQNLSTVDKMPSTLTVPQTRPPSLARVSARETPKRKTSSVLQQNDDQQGGDDNQGQQDGVRVPQVVEVPIKLKCVVCRKEYKKGRLLVAHMRQAHPADEGSGVKCGRCNYVYESLKSFRGHHDLVHNRGKK